MLVGASIVVFAMMHLAPGDPARAMLGVMATPADLARLRAQLGLNDPLYVQYFRWLGRALTGDLGQSIHFHLPVSQEIGQTVGATMLLAGASFVFAAVVGGLLGVLAGTRPRSLIDRLVNLLATFGIAMPSFYVGILLIVAFVVDHRWFPMTGLTSFGGGGIGDIAHHLVLPCIALGLAPLTVVARMMRAAMIEELGRQYIVTAKAKGVPRRRVVFKHAVKNALIPTVDLLGLQVGFLLSSTALVEVVFTYPGIGNLLITAIIARDLPLTQGIVLVLTISYVLINIVTDLCHALLDPEIRLA